MTDKMILRLGYLLAGILLALAPVRLLLNPLVDQKAAFEKRLERLSIPPKLRVTGQDIPYDQFQKTITAREGLWAPVIKEAVIASGPDWGKILEGVAALGGEIQTPDGGVKLKIRTSAGDKGGTWVVKGDRVNSAVIKDITPDAIVFVVTQNGKEYTRNMKR